jgi:hypothetical protein
MSTKSYFPVNRILLFTFLIIAYLFILPQKLLANEPIEEFLESMVRGDNHGMQLVVREHKKEMVIAFFSIINEATSLLKRGRGGDETESGARMLVGIASEIAQSFNNEFEGVDILYSQFKESSPLLTTNARTQIYSDESLARFLLNCAKMLGEGTKWKEVESDLVSIMNAATETPEQRGLRMLSERLYEIRRKEAIELEHKQVTMMQAQVNLLQQKRDVEALLEILGNQTRDIRLRRMVIIALGDLRVREALDNLIKYLNDDRLKDAIIESLGKIGDKRAVPVLIQKLGDESVSEKASTELIRFRSEQTIEALIEKLGTDLIGKRAATTLNNIWGEQAASNYLKLLHTKLSVQQRRAVIQSLGSLRYFEAIDELLKYANNDDFVEVVIKALGKLGGKQAIEALIQKLDDAVVGKVAEEALINIGIPAVPALRHRLEDVKKSAGMKRSANILTLLQIIPETSEERIRILIAQEDVSKLIMMGPTILPIVINTLKSPDSGIRITAIKVLGTYFGVAILVFLLLSFYIHRDWIWPKTKVELARGEYKQINRAIYLKDIDKDIVSGTILQTLWARSWVGRQQRIKIEIFIAEARSRVMDGDAKEWRSINFPILQKPVPSGDMGGYSIDQWGSYLDNNFNHYPPIRGISDYPLADLIVSTGTSVRQGTYLAKGPNGAIRIKVT